MNKSLRKTHRYILTILAVVLPVFFVISLLGRRPMPVMEPMPLRPVDQSMPVTLADRSHLWSEWNVVTRIVADQLPPTRLAVELIPHEYLKTPDPLLYWHPGSRQAGQLPGDAYLLGSISGMAVQRFVLPEAAFGAPGQLIIYSLAHQQVVDRATMPPFIP